MTALDHSRIAYGIKEAAQAMSVGRNLIYDEINAGRLPAFKAGTRTLIAAADLAAWIADRKANAALPAKGETAKAA